MSPTLGHAGKATTVSDAADAAAETRPISRREFLNYLLGGSLALLAAESCAASTWFALPSLKYGSDTGIFRLAPADIPSVGASPTIIRDGGYWLVNTVAGLLALSGQCVFRPCLLKWVASNNRFERPCCGSKFSASEQKLQGLGPAQRNLDRFVIQVMTLAGKVITSSDGDPVDISSAKAIVVDTHHLVLGSLSDDHRYQGYWSQDQSCQCEMFKTHDLVL